jgi:chromate reductase, NAD(P)H dehydrogenase (quinone)
VKVLVISGSLRAGSYNTALARAARELAPGGVEVDLYEGLGELPPFDADSDGAEAPHQVRDLRRQIDAADGVLFVTPEYNGSIPGVLKNAVDWASRPHRGAALSGKIVAVAGATPGQYGAMWAQQDLRRVLGIAGARVIAGEVAVPRAHEAFDKEGRLASAAIAELLRDHLAALVDEAVPPALAA